MDSNNQDFSSTVLTAVAKKREWFDTVLLPKIQDNYRLHLTCVNTIIEALVKKSLINHDPYKKDKKISSIVLPDDHSFNENERATQLGIRLSDYQSMLDYICNYMKFTVEQLNTEKIRKLLDLNAVFSWNNLSPNSPKINSRSLFICISEAKNGSQPLQVAMINDSLSKTKEALDIINAGLLELSNFIRELYKCDIRRTILQNKDFDRTKYNANEMLGEIKRLFPSCMPKRPFATDLVNEVIAEETSPNKADLQTKLLAKFKIEDNGKSEQKKNTVTTHDILMDALRILGTSNEQYAVIQDKLNTNHNIIQNGRKSFGDKFARFWRKVFGLPEKPEEYQVTLIDPTTKESKKEKLNYTEYYENLTKRIKYYSAIVSKQSLVYQKLDAQEDTKTLEFLNKQMTDNNQLQISLSALDEFFKSNAPVADRSKIKGIKMDLSIIKNILIKVNQYRAEYVAMLEEKEQMMKLGITE
ncbi:MAG: hypothetical protein IKI40_06225 [Treponema sp.]|nr:hypothetical protein [Treponema sp.]